MSMNETDNTSLTDLEPWMILEMIEWDNTKKLTSTIIYMALLIIMGLVGNTVVLAVYTVRLRTGTTRIFILALAVVDVLNSIFGMSGEIIDIVHSYTFFNNDMCKIIRFNNYITVFSSIYILIGVSIDRYRKVCKPYSRQITEKGAKLMVGGAIFAASVITIPAIILNGIHEYEYIYNGQNITVSECTFNNFYQDTWYPKVLVGAQFLIFVFSLCILITMYLMIGRKIFIHSRFSFKKLSAEKKKELVGEKKTEKSVSFGAVQVNKVSNIEVVDDSVVETSEVQSEGYSEAVPRYTARQSIQLNKRMKARKIKNRTTLMLVGITMVFIASCVPYLTISVMKRLDTNFVTSMSDTEYKIYNIFLRSYFFNSVANPIVYSFCNARFREEAKRVLVPCFR
ncbi:hypothetical protein SNE40_021634 [Patella caerulea]|uniref:G-protein coupled receptors family 1 profile domain-containing protein n=1 Tax=Patella caerulea TaxID=87958 RepID=A0AAN8J4B7_PATCE